MGCFSFALIAVDGVHLSQERANFALADTGKLTNDPGGMASRATGIPAIAAFRAPWCSASRLPRFAPL